MKLKNVLIVVKDIERARQFYHDLFGLEMILDNNGNMIMKQRRIKNALRKIKQDMKQNILIMLNGAQD